MSYTRDENGLFMRGRLIEPLTAEHEAYGETLYLGKIEIMRLSGTADTLPITVPGRLMRDFRTGDTIELSGELRSYNRQIGGTNRLLLRPFARRIECCLADCGHVNSVILTGCICRETVFRTTPFGREITDMLIAVNRDYKKADYIPCIAWGGAAHAAKELCIGARVRIEGRLQSRQYTKNENGIMLEKTAYELSIARLERRSARICRTNGDDTKCPWTD